LNFTRGFPAVLIEAADVEFTLMIEEEIQRRIKEQDMHDQHEKKKAPKLQKKKDDTDYISQDMDTDEQNDGQDSGINEEQNGHEHSNGTLNGHHENGQTESENGSAILHEA
jgi:hypothetical protein